MASEAVIIVTDIRFDTKYLNDFEKKKIGEKNTNLLKMANKLLPYRINRGNRAPRVSDLSQQTYI